MPSYSYPWAPSVTTTCASYVWPDSYGTSTMSLSWAQQASQAAVSITTSSIDWWTNGRLIADRMEALADSLRDVYRIPGERQGARDRAEKLLRESLSAEQLAEFAQHGHFHVLAPPGPDGKRRQYRINRGRIRNIEEVSPGGIVIARLCVHPLMDVPDADTMLSQKLWLETREEEIRRVANHSRP